jgi:hypothetical protein
VCFTYGVGCPHRYRHLWVGVGDKAFTMIQDHPFTRVPTPTPTPLYSPTPVPTPFGGCVEPFPLLEGTAFRGINAVLAPAGGTQCFDVVAAPACCWAPAVEPYSACGLGNVVSDVAITAGNHGCGPGTVCFSYAMTPGQCTPEGRLVPIRFGVNSFKGYQPAPATPTSSPGT